MAAASASLSHSVSLSLPDGSARNATWMDGFKSVRELFLPLRLSFRFWFARVPSRVEISRR